MPDLALSNSRGDEGAGQKTDPAGMDQGFLIQANGSYGIPASACVVAYDSIQRLLLVRFFSVSCGMHTAAINSLRCDFKPGLNRLAQLMGESSS